MTTSRQIATADVANLLFDHPGYIANNWYLPYGVYIGATGTNPGIGSIRLFPAYIKEKITIGAMGVRVAAGATGNVQAAIYAHNAATGRPTGIALGSTGSMSTASSAANVTAVLTVNSQVGPGLYWFATNTDNIGSTLISQLATSINASMLIGSATNANIIGGAAANLAGVSTPSTFGTWGDLTSATFTEVAAGSVTIPLTMFQVVSVP